MIRTIKNVFHLFIALFANLYFNFPGKKIKVIGITGTDGKTTTTHLIHHILKTSGKKASMISSVYALVGGKVHDTGFHVTTPSSWFIQKQISNAVKAKDDFFVLEVTSHGLDQERVWGIPFFAGVITNVTHEHLDYHKTYESYLQSKAKLFLRSQHCFINKEDDSYVSLNLLLHDTNKVTTYGISKGDVNFNNFSFSTLLPGYYNKQNCLAAIAVCKEIGIPDKTIRNALSTFSEIPGRFNVIHTNLGFDVIIDFAHTPNAIDKVLSTIIKQNYKRIIHVFGSAGLRDHTKRPLMGEYSSKYADVIILTEEDYRVEDINDINRDIKKGIKNNVAFFRN